MTFTSNEGETNGSSLVHQTQIKLISASDFAKSRGITSPYHATGSSLQSPFSDLYGQSQTGVVRQRI